MNREALVDILLERLQIPRWAIEAVLAEQGKVIEVALRMGESVPVEKLFTVRPSLRTYAPRREGKAMPKVRKIGLAIKPTRRFRKEMDSWTSSESSPTTKT